VRAEGPKRGSPARYLMRNARPGRSRQREPGGRWDADRTRPRLFSLPYPMWGQAVPCVALPARKNFTPLYFGFLPREDCFS